MKHLCALSLVLAFLLTGVRAVHAQTPQVTAQPAFTDVYHVHFNKAAPGQAAALGDSLRTPTDPKDAMADHFVLLRHQEGDDWDYCLIRHVGTKASVEIGPPPSSTAPALSAWHNDTFVAGPAWADVARVLGVTAGSQTAGSVFVVSVFRAVPGHRDQLLKSLTTSDPATKVQVGHVTLAHLEGGPWQFLTVDRYNSWQDFAADHAGAATASDAWAEVRQHVAYHTDTIADRVGPK